MTTRIQNSVTIARPVGVVFEFVTTPGNWPRWHPSSLSVSGATDHSLAVGEQVTEQYLVAGRKGEVVWTVTESKRPHCWVIEGQIVGRQAGGTVSYSLIPQNGSTHFEREFRYPTPGLLFRLLNALFFRRRIAAESAEAVRRLKEVLERERHEVEERERRLSPQFQEHAG
jgi:uncharacterized protein YndB with AHSA1/START domain